MARSRSRRRRTRLLLGSLGGLGLGRLLSGALLLSAAAGGRPARPGVRGQLSAGRIVLVLLPLFEGVLPECPELRRSLGPGTAQVRVGGAVYGAGSATTVRTVARYRWAASWTSAAVTART